MRVVAQYSFNNGADLIAARHAGELAEVRQAVAGVNATVLRTKLCREQGQRHGQMLYNPNSINTELKQGLIALGWQCNITVPCVYPTQHYLNGYAPLGTVPNADRKMDFAKNHLGLEMQFGKYAFVVYDICAKMPIFKNNNLIDAGIEIVPIHDMKMSMSSGVAFFEQVVWDLEHRGVADIDVPVLVLGVDV